MRGFVAELPFARALWAFAVLVALTCSGCGVKETNVVTQNAARAPSSRAAVRAPHVTTSVWLIGNGFHSSLALRMGDLPPRLRQVSSDAKANYVLIGWGNAMFYRAKFITPLHLMAAVLVPMTSALHVVPVRGSIPQRFPNSDVFRFDVTVEGFHQLVVLLERSFDKHDDGRLYELGVGYFPESRFYRGSDLFFFPYTCNVWTAHALHRAGLPFIPWRATTASVVSVQASRFGVQLGKVRKPKDPF